MSSTTVETDLNRKDMPELIDLLQTPLAYLTNPSIRLKGELKSIPDDFIVEEIPVYLPCGSGEHLFLWVEKRDISAEFLQQHISKQLGIRRDDIGMAGLKDRRAITRQWISVPATCQARIDSLQTDQIQILEFKTHTNKLKTGHLKGNRFTIILRTSTENAYENALAIRDELQEKGIPNYFGTQRFGINGETLQTGQDLLRGTLKPEGIPRQRRKFLTRIALSAVQSALFNAVLSRRIETNLAHRVLLGDVLQVTASKGPFVSTNPEIDQRRFNEREVVTSGPLFGPKMKPPEGDQFDFEMDFLKQSELTLQDFSKFKKLTSGTRRPLLLWLDSLEVEQFVEGIKFQFDLPTGAYATVALREFLKWA